MNCKQTEILISGYLDNELTQQQQQQVQVHLDTCQSCRKNYKDMQLLKSQMSQLCYPRTDSDVLDELENDLLAKTSSGIGWFLIILGAIFFTGMVVVEFLTADNTAWYEKLFIVMLTIGPLALLASVIRQRMLTYKKDKYRKVKL